LRSPEKSILIATLGSKPQIITLSVDCLINSNQTPDDVIVIHTTRQRLETTRALQLLQHEFAITYAGISLTPMELSHQGKALLDVTSPEEVQLAFQSIYSQVRAAKLEGNQIHFQIAGGRRTLSVFGMAVAQMLFDDQDHLWHLSSHASLEDSGSLHAGPDEWARLIPIPLVTWGGLSPVFDALREVENPLEAANTLSRLRLKEQWDAARVFAISRLSPAERTAVQILVRDGLNQAEIAARIGISPRTVEQQLRSAYRKAADHWQLEDVNQAQLVRLLAPFYVSVS
jgi:CRISPR-associated protein Csx14